MAQTATDPQLVLKVTPPRVPKAVLDRPRMSSTRAEFADKSVIFLQTPSGFGKTALLAQWRKEALQRGAVVAWLTLDNRDNVNRLVRGLTAAMRVASGRADFGLASLRAAEGDPDLLEGLTAWLAEVAELAMETTLILDDVHALPEETISGALMYLLINSPANLKIILTSRRPVALPVASLPVRGSFVELTASELRLSESETAAVLQARFGARIDADSCARLHELTEGWPLGVQLAVSTIERSPDIRAAIAGFAMQASDVERYFVECLINQLPPELAKVLVCFSVVDALSPALCSALLAKKEPDDILQDLRELTPIFTEGVNTDWFRIHPLARDFLQDRFELLSPVERKRYHGRAGHWLAEHGCKEQAARHLLTAGEEQAAYALIERSLYDLLLTGQVARVAEWLERMPRAEIERRIRLRITLGWLLAQSERHAEAIELMSPLIDDPAVDSVDRMESRQVCATAAIFADDIAVQERMAASWQTDDFLKPAAIELISLNHAALLMIYRGSPEQARYAYKQFHGDDGTVGRYVLGWRDWIVGYSYLWEGHVAIAAEKLAISLERAEADSGRRSPISVTLAAALAMARLECNQLDAAAALLADRLDVLERSAPPTAIAMGYSAAIRLAGALNDEKRAFELLDYLYALGQARKLPRLCVISLGERIRMHALRGRGDICAVVERKLDELLAAGEMKPLGLLRPVSELQRGIAYGYAAVAQQDWQRVLKILDALPSVAENIRRGREALQIILLRALARKRCGEDGVPLLNEAISMAGVWGFARILEDTHPDLVDWAHKLQTDAEPAAGMRLRSDSVGSPAAAAASVSAVRVAKSSLLSPKEREVLQLLAGNLSNKQIALAMGVSDETIKWHLKNLFGKLNAGTRKHLLDRARMMGILQSASQPP